MAARCGRQAETRPALGAVRPAVQSGEQLAGFRLTEEGPCWLPAFSGSQAARQRPPPSRMLGCLCQVEAALERQGGGRSPLHPRPLQKDPS